MSSLVQGARIYQGAWIDWSRGLVLGSTITLSARKGAVITAFLAFFVTVVGACLWRIACYILHQASASPDAKDGIHHQHQLIFRNTSSPSEATRAFAENAISWRKNGKRAWLRSLPLASFALIFMLTFAAASLMTSLVTKATGSGRLIISDNCGWWSLDGEGKDSMVALNTKDLADTITAASYARACYGLDNQTTSLQCNMYEKKALSYTINANLECNFGGNICNGSAYQLDTHRLNSHDDFGINTPRRDRVEVRKMTTCAPLQQDGYVTVETSDGTSSFGAKGDRIRYYNYGTWDGVGGLPNTTWWMNQHSFVDNWGYQFDAILHDANSSNGWVPIPALARDDADTTIMFLAPNAIQFETRNNDPFFHANFEVPLNVLGFDETYYLSDNWANVMACTDQYQFCNPVSDTCSPLSGYFQTTENLPSLNLNSVQTLMASNIILNLRSTTMYQSISGRGAAALRAQETVHDLSQAPLPDNQWQIEVQSWFSTSLAKLQRNIASFAAGPENVVTGSHLERPQTTLTKALCYSQKVRLTSNTTSFSVLGISITFIIGAIIILIYLSLEMVVGMIQKRYNWGDYRRLRWIMDDKMQIQRMAFEEAGMGGEWENLTGNVPVTKGHDVFGGLGHVDRDEPRLGEKWASLKKEDREVKDEGQMRPMPMHSSVDGNTGVGGRGEKNERVAIYQKPVYQAL